VVFKLNGFQYGGQNCKNLRPLGNHSGYTVKEIITMQGKKLRNGNLEEDLNKLPSGKKRLFKCIVYKTNNKYYEILTIYECIKNKSMS